MDMTLGKYLGRLNELQQKKMVLLQKILTLTREQTETITENGLDGLNRLIAEKQLWIDSLKKDDEEFVTCFQKLKKMAGISKLDQLDVSKLEGTASEDAKLLKNLTAEIMETIGVISEIEKVNSEKSKSLLSKFSCEVKKLNQGKKMVKAYKVGPINPPSYFVDKKK
jgi:hypothetical protein